MRTIQLIERRRSTHRLHPEDAAFLLREHSWHLQVMPTTKKHWYRIMPTHQIGVFWGPRSRFVIQPKIPLRSLFFLMNLSWQENHATTWDRGDNLVALFAQRLVEKVDVQCQRGLPRGYVEQFEEGAYLRGRLDVPTQMRETSGAQTSFHYHSDNWTVEVVYNRILKATLRQLLESSLISEEDRQSLRHVLTPFEDVTTITLTEETFELAEKQVMEPEECSLLEFCHWTHRGLLRPSLGAVGRESAFLVSLEQVFERYVTKAFLDSDAGQAPLRAQAQWTKNVSEQIEIRPDLVVQSQGETPLVLDVKWKRLQDAGPAQNDLYQIISYCTLLGAKRGLLVYPGANARSQRWSFPGVGFVIEAHSLPVTKSEKHCRRALDQFVRETLGDLTQMP